MVGAGGMAIRLVFSVEIEGQAITAQKVRCAMSPCYGCGGNAIGNV
jgi:hypothetical protein